MTDKRIAENAAYIDTGKHCFFVYNSNTDDETEENKISNSVPFCESEKKEGYKTMNPITEKLNALKTEYYENTGLYIDPTCYSADTSLGETVSECISEESDAEISRTGKKHIELLSTLYFGGYYDMAFNDYSEEINSTDTLTYFAYSEYLDEKANCHESYNELTKNMCYDVLNETFGFDGKGSGQIDYEKLEHYIDVVIDIDQLGYETTYNDVIDSIVDMLEVYTPLSWISNYGLKVLNEYQAEWNDETVKEMLERINENYSYYYDLYHKNEDLTYDEIASQICEEFEKEYFNE
jgi:hypothetical protein